MKLLRVYFLQKSTLICYKFLGKMKGLNENKILNTGQLIVGKTSVNEYCDESDDNIRTAPTVSNNF